MPCPGYRADQPAGVEFKDQTTITAKRAEQRYKAKAKKKSPSYEDITPPDSRLVEFRSPPAKISTTPEIKTSTSPKSDFSEQQLLLVLSEKKRANPFIAEYPIHLMSPGAERAQIYQEFITSYFPRKRYGEDSGYYNFFQTVAIKNSQVSALEQGMDALSLVQLGSLYKDQRLLKEAGSRYGTALRSMANSIARGDFMHDDDVLAAVATLSICELFEEIANMGEGWAKHVQGTNVLFSARGPDSFKSEMGHLIYSNVKHGSLLWALISRKAPFLAAPEWRELAFQGRSRSESCAETRFYDVAIQVPEVLQRHDAIDTSSPIAIEEIDKILQMSFELEMKMRAWWSEWQDEATVDNMVDCELRPIEDFPTFASLVPDRTFVLAFTFPDFQTGYIYSVYWMVIFHLRSAMQSLMKMRHNIDVNWYPEPQDVVPEEELLGYVLNLCQCMPYFVEPVSCSAGHIGVFLPMRTAAFYFTDHGHWHWLKWIGAVRNSVFTKGLSPPTVPGRTAGIPANRPLVDGIKT